MALRRKTNVKALLYNELLRLNGIAAQKMEDSSLSQTERDYYRERYERGELTLSLYRQGKTKELRDLFFGQRKTIVRKKTSPLSEKKERRRKKLGRNKDKFRTI